MRTRSMKLSEIKKEWLVVDATEQTLGRLASEVARVLRGKHKPSFTPHLDCGDNVIVINAEKIRLTGNKWADKVYYHHTGYIGGIKGITAQELKDKHPERIVQKAVKGMLPKNKLANRMLAGLRVYAGAQHPHTGQNPKAMGPRTA